MKNKIIFIIFLLFLINLISATEICQVYDNFSSGTLNIDKWEVRPDVEGQPLMEEYWVDNNLNNFHTKQNTMGDHRVYLVPKINFTTGDIIEYDFNVISKEGNYMQMDLLTGDQYIRVGIMGYINGIQGYDELGTSHIKIEFQENNFHLERTSPSNVTLIDNLALTNANGKYELYIGSISGHNGITHIDYDNFTICNQVINITLNIPTNNKVFKITDEVKLNWNIDYFRNNLNCSVFLNKNLTEIGIFEFNNSYLAVLNDLQKGKYFWNVICKDIINEKIKYSESRVFTIVDKNNDTKSTSIIP